MAYAPPSHRHQPQLAWSLARSKSFKIRCVKRAIEPVKPIQLSGLGHTSSASSDPALDYVPLSPMPRYPSSSRRHGHACRLVAKPHRHLMPRVVWESQYTFEPSPTHIIWDFETLRDATKVIICLMPSLWILAIPTTFPPSPPSAGLRLTCPTCNHRYLVRMIARSRRTPQPTVLETRRICEMGLMSDRMRAFTHRSPRWPDNKCDSADL